MIVSVNGINEHLETYISENYEFRKNLINRILGKDPLEYRRADANSWNPVSKFIYKERRKILSENEVDGKDATSLYPEWLIEKVASQRGEQANEFIENKNYLKIINDLPVRVTGVSVVKAAKREAVMLKEGDKCYVSFGVKKKLFRKYTNALPAVVESVRETNGNEYYNVFILKFNKKTNKVDYFGRHLVLNTEVGRTPEEAAKNIAYSQSIY